MKKNRRILLFLMLVLLLVGGAAGGGIYYYLFVPPFKIDKTVDVYIDRDDTIDSVYLKIEQKALPQSMKAFAWLASYYEYDKRIRTGRYQIKPDDTSLDVVRRFSRGIQLPVKVSFNNIRTRQQLAARIGEQLMIDSTEIADKLFDPSFQQAAGYADETVISLFIPNTYEVYWNVSVDDFLARMQKEHQRFWSAARLEKAKAIGLSPEEVSTLASIVEEETNNDGEKPVVAGLYLNRLKRKMPLQADPTVKFALQDFTLKRIYNEHLTYDSPYNTYKYAGLPPGPIRIPSIRGLDSVLNYEKHNYLYMCAKEDFSGIHNFASTFGEHQRNARKYWDALNKRKIF